MKYLLFTLILTISCFGQISNDLSTKLSLAQTYEQSGDYEKAAELYENLYQTNPQNMQYINSLYRVYTQLKNYAAIIDVLEKRLSAVPDDISSYGMLGSTYHRMGNEAKATEVWEIPLERESNNPLTYRLIADYALERRAFDQAIDFYSRGKSIANDKLIFSFDLARLYTLTMQFEEAAEEYCFILLNEPKQMSTVETRIFEYIGKPGALDLTIPVFEKYEANGNISHKYILARLYTEKEQFDEALDIYLEIDEKQSNKGKDLFSYADFLLKENHFKLASGVYQKIIELYPESPLTAKAKLGYARSLESELFEEYVKSIPLWKPFYQLTRYESEKIEMVLSAFNQVIELYEHSEPAYEALLRSGVIKYYLQNDFDEAKKLLNVVTSEAPISQSAVDAFIELANIYLIEGNLSQAEKNYSQLLNGSRLHFEKKNLAAYKIARIYFYQRKFDKAREQLLDVLKNLKDNSANDALELSLILNSQMNDSINVAHFAEAELLAERKKFSEAADIYKKIAENPQAFVMHSIALLRVGEMMLAENNYSEAVAMFENISAEGDKNIYADKALYLLGKIHHFGLKDYGKAQEFYQKLLAEFPNSIYVNDARDKLKILMKNPS